MGSRHSAVPVKEVRERGVIARCLRGGPQNECVLWDPSLIQLLAQLEFYDGKRVQVIGFVNFEFERNGLYVSREDWEQNITANGLWIDPPAPGTDAIGGPAVLPNRRYVLVEATFHGGRGGHFGLWSGSLDSVTRIEPWGGTK